MNLYRDYLLAAFIFALAMSAACLWVADMQSKRQAAANSIEAVRVSLTPFERDRARAVEKIDRVYGRGK